MLVVNDSYVAIMGFSGYVHISLNWYFPISPLPNSSVILFASLNDVFVTFRSVSLSFQENKIEIIQLATTTKYIFRPRLIHNVLSLSKYGVGKPISDIIVFLARSMGSRPPVVSQVPHFD